MSLDLNNVIRSAGATLVGLVLVVPIGINQLADGGQRRSAAAPTGQAEYLQDITDDLTKACVDYRISKADTKLERESKNTIDEYFGGEVSYRAVCDFVLG